VGVGVGWGGGRGRVGVREGGREGASVTSQLLSSPATPWMLMDDWPYVAAERSEAGSFTGGAAAAEASICILGTWRRSNAV
jgi:hypothetical protein